MDTLQAIKSRKSVRSYTGSISDADLKEIISAGIAAPVGMGKYDTVQLTVVRNKEFLHDLDRACAKMFGDESRTPLYGAPVLVIVSTKLAEGDNNVAYSNCACIVENMSLAAVSKGLGTCHIWGAIHALNINPDLLAKINLPDGFTAVCGIVLGDTDEKLEVRDIDESRVKVVNFD